MRCALGSSKPACDGEPVYLHVKNGYFSNITSSLQSLPSQIQLIDESDKSAVPGLIDMHVHLTRDEPGAEINLAPVYLAHGVTSVRDVGSSLRDVKRMRSRIENGEIPGPRIFFCGPQLNGKVFRPGMCALQTADETRKQVRTLCAEGVHALKIYDQLRPELAHIVIEEACKAEIPVCGHLGQTSAQEAINSGISGIEHLSSLAFDLFPGLQRNPFSRDMFKNIAETNLSSSVAHKLCDSVVRQKVFIDPTMVVYERIVRFPELKSGGHCSPFIPQILSDYWLERMDKFAGEWTENDFEVGKRSFDKLKLWLGSIQREGALVCAGTDTPNPYLVPGKSLLDEIQLLAEAGLSNADAIGAATSVAAEALRKSVEIGAIESGKRADFVLLQGNPLDDISSIEKIVAVFKDGVRYEPTALKRVAATMSAAEPTWVSPRRGDMFIDRE